MLPTELNEAILDHLTDEPHALAMCARAHRSLLTLSHQRLFADIRINFDWQAASSRPAQLLAALNASPYLGTYVRRLTVSCEGASFRICAHILPSILDHLSALRFFSARRVFQNMNTPNAGNLGHALQCVLQLPTLEEVCLRMTIDFPFHFLRAHPLRHLALTDAGETGRAPLAETGQPPIKPRTLKLCVSMSMMRTRAVQWLQSSQVDLSDLRALMLDAQWMESSSARRVLPSAAKRLQLLAVTLPSQYVDDNDGFLRILAQPSFRWPALRTLVIYTHKWSNVYSFVYLPDTDQLKSLDTALAENKDMYPALQEVVLLPCAVRGERPLRTFDAWTSDGEEWWSFRGPDGLQEVPHPLLARMRRVCAVWEEAFTKCAAAGMLRDTPSAEIDV
ncbi:hypothetical protein K525DRAFT_188445 [Schizophyllum commune Loenen D]|nr:hypothetical protein K525DRAFT_188445 [Schizophyllum commune Loenen D]